MIDPTGFCPAIDYDALVLVSGVFLFLSVFAFLVTIAEALDQVLPRDE